MCGIAGFWDVIRKVSNENLPVIVQRMSDRLIHRGPVSGGIWVDAEVGIALGHRRLAIVDLSTFGHQPMVSADGRYVITFNGEIYNFLELRRQLESLGHSFQGDSDTEVMLSSLSQWGVVEAVKRFNGMFAFALWDREERVLHIGRDRLGEKPLYYGFLGQTFIFSSELKALKVHPDFQPEINRDALALFFRYSYIPSPYSIYQGIYKLPPATILSWNGKSSCPQPIPYWSFQETASFGSAKLFRGTETEAVKNLEALLLDAVKMRMVADVPLGAFLSGGIDSSTVVALMQANTSQKVKTFSIGFNENEYNESPYAKAVAQHLGCDHTEFYVTPQDALAVIPKLPILYDEPFSDPSGIPTFLVSKLAKQHVTVALSGDAGDELFAGYNRYLIAQKRWDKICWMPKIMRHNISHTLSSTVFSPNETANSKLNASISSIIRYLFKKNNIYETVNKFSTVLAVPNREAIYTLLVSHWKQPEALVIGSSEPSTVFEDCQQWTQDFDFIQHMMCVDTLSYLPDDILVKVDRASMGVSLESRIPLLDHRVVEFAWQTPLSMKIRHGKSKWLLRQVLHKYVPKNLIERPKMGFEIPIDSWLRGPLKDWAQGLLEESKLHSQGYLNSALIQQKWKEHISGEHNWHYYLWDVLMFQAWLEENL
jgi:asparagine synthase (glutamine-hydrolysing)